MSERVYIASVCIDVNKYQSAFIRFMFACDMAAVVYGACCPVRFAALCRSGILFLMLQLIDMPLLCASAFMRASVS